MSEPYLIAHLVRGEPAFDVAIKFQIGDEEGWIIPTSGHRAYPYWWIGLHEVPDLELLFTTTDYGNVMIPPPNHPDHYTTHATPGTGRTDLLSLIPLKPVEPIKRRV